MSSRRKLWLGFGASLALMAGAAMISCWLIWELNDALNEQTRLESSHEMNARVSDVGIAVLEYLRDGNSEHRERLAQNRDEFKRALATYRRGSRAKDSVALAIKLEHGFREYLRAGEDLMARRDEQHALSMDGFARLGQLETLVPGSEGESDSEHLVGELRSRIAEMAARWLAYEQTGRADLREEVLEAARSIQRLLARDDEARNSLGLAEDDPSGSPSSQLDEWVTSVQTALVLEEAQSEQLQRFRDLGASLGSDLHAEIQTRRGSTYGFESEHSTILFGMVVLLLLLLGGAALGLVTGRTALRGRTPIETSPEDGDFQKEFIPMLAHELRNPLAPIRSAVQVLEVDPPADERVIQLRDVIGRQVRQLERLINDLLDVSRIRRGLLDLSRETIDLSALVRETTADYEGPLAERQIRLDVSLPKKPVWVLADRTRMTQVIGNLLQNAAKFTNPGGGVQVDLETHSENRQAALTFRDSGIGMGESTLDTLFRPFQQGKRSAGRGAGGLGLGLALVKGLVDLHGGEVKALSRGKALGSEFSVWLPLAQEAPPDEPASGTASTSRGSKRRDPLL